MTTKKSLLLTTLFIFIVFYSTTISISLGQTIPTQIPLAERLQIAVAGTLTAQAVIPSPSSTPAATLYSEEEFQTALAATLSALTPTATATPPATPTPTISYVVDLINVPGNTVEGVVYDCPTTGTYLIRIDSGAYSPWSQGIGPNNGMWRTLLYIYIDSEVIWGDNGTGFIAPISSDDVIMKTIGNFETPNSDRTKAEEDGIGKEIIIDCTVGSYLRFMPADAQGSQEDNFGEMQLSIARPE
jgi:hypothetical protein